MTNALQSLFAFVLALGVLIVFHEFGHFWVARLCGVRILRFSIGFGRTLWARRFGADRTELAVCALPLGGYVKMLDEREGPVDARELDRTFNRKPVSRRIAIVAAGPLFNLLFAVAAYWLVFLIGVTGLRPVIGGVAPASPAARAGLDAGDEIRAVEGHRTPTWPAVIDVTVSHAVGGETIDIEAADRTGVARHVSLDLSSISIDQLAGGHLLERVGLQPQRPLLPPVIGAVVAGGAAARAGLRPGDVVLSVDSIPVRDWGGWVEIVRAHPARALHVQIRRGRDTLSIPVTPQAERDEQGRNIGRIGAAVRVDEGLDRALFAKEAYPPGAALWKALDRTVDMSTITLRVLGKMIVGRASVRNLSGPISIAQYAGESAGVGFVAFLGFLAVVSVSLGVLNLLPIPILDGGHLMYYLMEIVKGSPVSETIQGIGQQVGLAILLGLMGIALYNDILRLLG